MVSIIKLILEAAPIYVFAVIFELIFLFVSIIKSASFSIIESFMNPSIAQLEPFAIIVA